MMRMRATRILPATAACLVSVHFFGTAVPESAAQAGVAYGGPGVANRDFHSPADVVVVDIDRSMAVFAARGEPVPLVVRVDSQAAHLMEEQLNDAFVRTREAFVSALEERYGTRQLEIRRINSSKFRAFRNEFQADNPLLPVNLILAQSWAKGYDGDSIRQRLVSAVRAVTREFYLADAYEDAVFFISSLPGDASAVSWNDIAQTVRLADPGEIIGPEEAGLYIRRGLDALDRSAGGFVTGLLHPTVTVDRHLTGLLMYERLGDSAVARRFKAGERIVGAGEPLEGWAVLALDTLDRMSLKPLEAAPDPDAKVVAGVEADETRPPRPKAEKEDPAAAVAAPVVDEQPAPKSGWLRNPFMVGGVVGGLVACVGAVLAVLLLRRPAGMALVAQGPTDQSELREALIPHLARELKNRLVQVLFAQRHALLENEEAASRRVEEMEARLARLQPAIADRIRNYERRIQTLEQEIEEKDQETRDLLRAKLVLARKELDEEISRSRLDWN